MIPVELTITDRAATTESADGASVPEDVRLAVYRITERALANVAKHAGASSCAVTWDIDVSNQVAFLKVANDGAGFDLTAKEAGETNSLGLVTMSDYADALGGELAVESAPGAGTSLAVRLPLNDDAPHATQGGPEAGNRDQAIRTPDNEEEPSAAHMEGST